MRIVILHREVVAGAGAKTAQHNALNGPKADKSDAEADIAEITSGWVWFAL